MEMEQPRHFRDWSPDEIRHHPLYGKEYPEEFEELEWGLDAAIEDFIRCFEPGWRMPVIPLEERMRCKEESFQRWRQATGCLEDGTFPGEAAADDGHVRRQAPGGASAPAEEAGGGGQITEPYGPGGHSCHPNI